MGFKNWKYGLHRLSQDEINRLSFPDGILLKVVPSETSLDSMIGMQRVLYMLQQYPSRFSFEIWKDKSFSFNFFSSSKSAEGMLKGQLSSVYPQVIIKRSEMNIPSIKEGDYVSSCSFVLNGVEFNLKHPEDFRYDPLRHILEAMKRHNSKIVVQILFEHLRKIPKNKRIILTQKYGDDLFFREVGIPVLKCLIRIIAASEDGFKARETCEHIARIFSVFDTDRCRFHPNIVSFPIVRNSYSVLNNVTKRRFSILSNSFMISVPELTSMVHLPIGAENSGVEYAQPSLSPSYL